MKIQFALITNFEIILQEKSLQDNNTILLLLFNRNINYEEFTCREANKET